MPNIEDLIRHFRLKALPVEGGVFNQTYKAPDLLPVAALPERYKTDRPAGTAILYLLTPDADSFSALHRLPTDEIYHFYMGDPVLLLQLYPDGHSEHIILGHDVLNGQQVQYVAPRHVWQGSFLLPGGTFALMGTTMAPGYVHSDYEGGDRGVLLERYPHEASLITRLTRLGAPLYAPPDSES